MPTNLFSDFPWGGGGDLDDNEIFLDVDLPQIPRAVDTFFACLLSHADPLSV